jgi:aminoglycoside phosphotransferase family enzyme/predicted kinase
MIVDDQSAAITFLSDPASYGAAMDPVERMETHASIVFLTGDRAYKLKRAVGFSYLDYSTIERRRQACEMELGLNRRTAPELYVAVEEIRRRKDGFLSFGGKGELVDCVVAMRRFDQAALLDNIARRGGLNQELMQELADHIAAFHKAAEIDRDYGGPAQLLEVVGSNASNLALASPLVFDASAVARLTTESHRALRRWKGLVEERRLAGKVRLCHGDLHLRNICLLEGRPRLFDCVEFSRALTCVDVLYDLSFLLMDLTHREFPGWANLVFNRYFDRESEVEGAVLLPLFMSMHAAIRAHVTMAAPQAQPGHDAFEQSSRDARRYLDEALSLLVTREPQILAVGGPSGTGKSTLAYAIAPELGHLPGARVLRSDVIRKRLMGVPPETRLPPEAYTSAVNNSVYAALLDEARRLAANGQSVVLDAVFARRDERNSAARLAAEAAIRFHGIWLDAPAEVLEARVEARSRDASDATVDVIRRQLGHIEKPIDWPALPASESSAKILAGARRILRREAAPPDRR